MHESHRRTRCHRQTSVGDKYDRAAVRRPRQFEVVVRIIRELQEAAAIGIDRAEVLVARLDLAEVSRADVSAWARVASALHSN